MAENPIKRAKKTGGGVAAAGGTNFHAMALAIAGTHLLRGTPIGWLKGLTDDTPLAIWAETEGPGDDARVELADGKTVEIQAKKGLTKGALLWDALLSLSRGIVAGSIDFGILAVAPDSSATVRKHLAKDVIRLGQGRTDQLSDIGKEWKEKLEAAALPVQVVCARLRIQTVNALETDGADIRAAEEVLRGVCDKDEEAGSAFDALYSDAVTLMELRGRWSLNSLTHLLTSGGIALRNDDFAAGTLAKLATWGTKRFGHFTLPSQRLKLGLEDMLPARLAPIAAVADDPHDEPAAALQRYHSGRGRRLSDAAFDGEWTGRFISPAVIVAGPGLGKSTLATRLAATYAKDGFAVLCTALKPVAAAMERGATFAGAFVEHALDASGITPDRVQKIGLRGCVVIADGLDDCGSEHERVARGLKALALAHPDARIIATSRPIGFDTAELKDWRHYELQPLDDTGASAHLGSLIAAASSGRLSPDDGYRLASRELHRSPVTKAIQTSPLMLAMAAALIVERGTLPPTRVQFFAELIELFERKEGEREASKLPPEQLAAVLDAVGWEIAQDPLQQLGKIRKACAVSLSPLLAVPPLAATAIIGEAIAFWEKAGIVEQVHHRGTRLLTFMHKNFGEFAAARHLVSLAQGERRAALERRIDDSGWSEVVSFASGLGLGDPIADLYLERRGEGYAGQLREALELVSDPEASLSDDKIRALTRLTFEIAEEEGDERFDAGVQLAEGAALHPQIIGPMVADHLADERDDVRLIAWAAAVRAGSGYFDPMRAEAALVSLRDTVRPSWSPSLLGGMRFGHSKDQDLLEIVALAALDAQPDKAELGRFIDTYLKDSPLNGMTFMGQVTALLERRGAKEFATSERLGIKPFGRWTFNSGDWDRATNRACRAIAAAVVDALPDKGDAPAPEQFLQFGALIQLLSIEETEAGDAYRWERDYDHGALATVIGAVIRLSPLDTMRLAAEAKALLRRLDQDRDLSLFKLALPEVEIPAPEWERAAALQLDRNAIEAAFHLGSEWVSLAAANLLWNMQTSVDEARRLLATSKGKSAFYAVIVARRHHPGAFLESLLERVETADARTAEYLMHAMGKEEVPFDECTQAMITQMLQSDTSAVVAEAAKVAIAWQGSGHAFPVEPARNAYLRWRTAEPEIKDGVIPPMPRAELFKLLQVQGALDDELLIESLSDRRSEITALAFPELERRLATDHDLNSHLGEMVGARRFAASTTAKALATCIALRDEQIQAIEAWLTDREPCWRRAAMTILERELLPGDQVKAHLDRLADDPEDEIRLFARSLKKKRVSQ